MLELNHPDTPHVLRAAALMDGLLSRGHAMTVSPSSARGELLAECFPLLTQLRQLNAEHFEAKPFIARAIGELEAGLRKRAALRGGAILEDRRHGEGACPACGAPIAKIVRDGTVQLIVCQACSDLYMRAHLDLESFEGFGTTAI